MILLTPGQRADILAHAEASYPHECCGFLLGTLAGAGKAVRRVRAAGNARHDEPRRRYLIPPEEVFRATRESGEEGLEILGFYHSHPDAPASPSDYDRAHAWPWYSYLIVSVAQGRATAARSFVLADSGAEFAEEPVEISP